MMKQLQQCTQCYSRACSRITELERQNTMLKEQINLYAQNFSAELTNYVILEKDTFEHLKECLCEAYAKFEALKQEGNALQACYNEAIKGFKALEQENKILGANNKELCKQLKAAGKQTDSALSLRSSRRRGNIWTQDSMLQSGWQFQPWMEVARDLEQVPETNHSECKENARHTEEKREKSMQLMPVKVEELCQNKPHQIENSDEVNRKSAASVKNIDRSHVHVNGSHDHDRESRDNVNTSKNKPHQIENSDEVNRKSVASFKKIDRSHVHVNGSHDHDGESRDSVNPSKVVRIQITLQRSKSSASSKADVAPVNSEKIDLKSDNTLITPCNESLQRDNVKPGNN